MYPKEIQSLIDKFSKFPSIGPKTAERIVFYLLKQKPTELISLAEDLKKIKDLITSCDLCHNFSITNPCPICSDNKRNKNILCLVTKPQDIEILEKTKVFDGFYFVLGKNLNPLDGSNENIKIKELITRINQNQIKELILALNPNLEGETTILYLKKILKQFPNLKISRLARGLPIGSDIEYADEITLESALLGRQEIK